MDILHIRRYRASDREAVWDLHNVALNAVGAHGGHGAFDDDLHHIESVYLSGGGEFLVGERAGRVVAMGALKPNADDLPEITRMRVHPDCWRRGFGRALLTRLEDRARELDYNRLYLVTTTRQTAAQKMYENHGYTEVGRGRAHRFEFIRYEKQLTDDDN